MLTGLLAIAALVAVGIGAFYALDRSDGDGACAIVADYLERHDRALVSALEVFA